MRGADGAGPAIEAGRTRGEEADGGSRRLHDPARLAALPRGGRRADHPLWQPGPFPGPLEQVDLGFIGVRLFFVLSGFLITGILLENRERARSAGVSGLVVLRQFYARRFLRIFPIYYFVVFAGLILAIPKAREAWPWLLTYTSNFYVPLHQEGVGRYGHFWTLAVEEQFYVFWPWLVLFVPWKRLSGLMVAVIAISPLYQLFWSDNAAGWGWGQLPFSCLDTLGVGALAALTRYVAHDKELWRARMVRIALPVGTAAYFGVHATGYYAGLDRLVTTFHELAFGVASAGLIAAATTGIGGPIGKLLELRPIVYLGKISYGIYVYHLFMPWGLAKIYGKIGLEFHDNGPTRFVVASAATILAAALSWHLFEKPINDLKRHAPYIPRRELVAESTG